MALGLFAVIAWTGLAGLMIPLGGILADVLRRHAHMGQEVLRAVVAFGGGALLAAAVLVLIPNGIGSLPGAFAVLAFFVGAGAALSLFQMLVRRGTKAGQMSAMMLDFLPESIALGAAVAIGSPQVVPLVLLISAQNLPEAFNAYRDLCVCGHRRAHVIMGLAALAAVGPLAGVVGYLWLPGAGAVSGAIMMATSGGIIALLFQDIIPSSERRGQFLPTWGGLLGFSVGLLGILLVD